MMLGLASSGDSGTVLPQGNFKLLYWWQKTGTLRRSSLSGALRSPYKAQLCYVELVPSIYKEMTSWALFSPLPSPTSWDTP